MSITEVMEILVEGSARSKNSFARRMGISRQALYSLMNTRSNISIKTLLQLCQASGYRLLLIPEENRKPVDSIEIDDC